VSARRDRIEQLRDQQRAIDAEIRVLETEERHANQIVQLEQNPNVLKAEPGANIRDYCNDLVLHAKRLNCTIRGAFNLMPLEASPSTDAAELVLRGYYDKLPVRPR
jgi:hypothetical protein